MQQVLHIFRKDVRHLWPQILIVLALMIAHAICDVRGLPQSFGPDTRANSLATFLNILLPLSLWSLVAWLIFEEPLPGDRQFWLTRPYSWPKLLASKVLFVFIFFNLPLFLSDCYILGAQGFTVTGVIPDLLLRQLFATALFILPSFAMATLTTDVSQFLLGWFILVLALLAGNILGSFWTSNRTSVEFGSGGIYLTVLASTAGAAILWQYARRRTTVARLVLLTVALSLFPASLAISRLVPWRGAYERAQSGNQFNVQITYNLDASLPPQSTFTGSPPGYERARIPLTVVGLPPKTILRSSARTTLEAGGRVWPQRGGVVLSSIELIGDRYFQNLDLPFASLEFFRGHLSNFHSSFDFEIVSDEVETRVPATTDSFVVPNLGLCHVFRDYPQTQITCRAGLTPALEAAVRWDSPGSPGTIIATFPERKKHEVPWGLSPTTDLGYSNASNVQPGSEFAFIPRRKIAQFQKTLELHNLDLTRYVLPR